MKQFLKTELSKGRFRFPESQSGQFFAYCEEILKWNRSIQLTGAKSVQEIIPHLLLSLAFGKFLEGTQNAKILDLGSGAGFPGIPLKIAMPELKIDLVEARTKRASFLKNAIRKLNFKDIRCFAARSENLGLLLEPDFYYDFIISRAAGTVKRIIDSSFKLMRPDGKWIILKGKKSLGEIDKLREAYGESLKIEISPLDGQTYRAKELYFVVAKKA